MKIVSISGLDGSGKSTQINLLQSYLESQGKKVFYFHAIQFGIAQRTKEFRQKYCPFCWLTRKCQINQESSSTESVAKSGKLGILLRKIFLKIDLCRFKKLYKKLEKESFDYIVSDRYFYDSVINIEYLKNNFLPLEKGELKRDLKDYKSPLTPLLQRGILVPDIAFYLQTNPELIMQRERRPDQGLEYLKKKESLYSNTSNKWNLKVVDGNRNKEEIFAEIKSLII